MSDRPQFSVEIEQRSDERALVVICGELDLYTAPQLHEALDAAVAAGVRHLVVDLSEVTFIDSTALGVLVGVATRLHSADGALAIACPDEKICRIFQITGLDQVFAMRTSCDEALSGAP